MYVCICTPYSIGDVIIDLGQTSDILSKWFIDNYLTLPLRIFIIKYDQACEFLRSVKANPYRLLRENSKTQAIVANV